LTALRDLEDGSFEFFEFLYDGTHCTLFVILTTLIIHHSIILLFQPQKSSFLNPTFHRHMAPLLTDFTDIRTVCSFFSVLVFFLVLVIVFLTLLVFLSQASYLSRNCLFLDNLLFFYFF